MGGACRRNPQHFGVCTQVRGFFCTTHPQVCAQKCQYASLLPGSQARLENISDLVGHTSTSVTEPVYRHEIRPALTDNATAVNRILKANATALACPCSGKPLAPQLAPETLAEKPV